MVVSTGTVALEGQKIGPWRQAKDHGSPVPAASASGLSLPDSFTIVNENGKIERLGLFDDFD
jgi:hypothetical protein